MKNKYWGLSTHINLKGCESELIKNPKEIERFCKNICYILGFKMMGKTNVKRFGKEKLEGYSMFQFIETSSIAAHFDETGNNAFIDIFSCKEYDTKKAVKFCKEFFKATKVSFRILYRI